MPPTQAYPTGGEYREALFNTKLCFKDPALVGGKVAMDSLGMPKPISGASASVFTIQNASGRRWAVKCFTRFVDDQAVRYQRISETLQTVHKPWRVEFEYLPSGVLCRGLWYPALKMEWIEASGLIPFIEKHLWEADTLASLAVKFANMVADLSALGIAHGDLQHGNLLVTPSGDLKLIDYDGMFVPSLVQIGACEKGHINYQSPARTMRTWGPYLDNFSAWIIYASLVALTIEPTLWTLLHDQGDEALLFHHDDFVDQRSSRALLALSGSPQSDLQVLSTAIRTLWTPDPRAIPPLDPASLPEPVKHSAPPMTVPSAVPLTSPNLATGATPAWVTQAQVGTQAAASGIQGSPSWVTGHLPALPLAALNAPRLALRLLAGFGLVTVIAMGLSVAMGVLLGIVAGVASCLLTLIFILVTLAMFRRTPEWHAKRDKLTILKERRADSSKAAREVGKFEHARRDIENREKKAVEKVAKQAEKTKASEQKELADLNTRLATQVQKLEKQRQSLQSSETKENGSSLRMLQQQHVETYLRGAAISAAKIPGIGSGVVRSLAANGITNASDFTGIRYEIGPRGGQQVYIMRRYGPPVHPSGVGDKKARDLEAWRTMLVSRAMQSQPSSLPPAQAQAIKAKYLQQRQQLIDQEKAARAQFTTDQRMVTQKWAQTHTAISGELATTRQAFAQERARADFHLTAAQKQASTVLWHRELAEREVAVYRNVSYRRYLASVVKTS